MTAIVCYLFFGFFYLQLTDAQTRLISGIEEVTALYLLPRYAPEADTVLQDLSTLARSLQHVAERIHAAQEEYVTATPEMRKERAPRPQQEAEAPLTPQDLAAFSDALHSPRRTV